MSAASQMSPEGPSQEPPGTAHPVPAHVAIIMDGNGRWAARRGLPRVAGHRAGVEAARQVLKHAETSGIKVLTLFSFSTENWQRPLAEVEALMGLMRQFVLKDLDELIARDVRVRVIGSRSALDEGTLRIIDLAEEKTAHCTSFDLVIAFNYGGRDELVRAARALAAEAAAGRLQPDAISDDMLAARLDTAGLPEVDLIIRTSGEHRLSNFLLWQCAYAELYFAEVFWPDFGEDALQDALASFRNRQRRFGQVEAGQTAGA